MTPRICTSPMPGCALGHLSGCSARATDLLFDQIDVGRRQETADDVSAAENRPGYGSLDGGHLGGDAGMDIGGERLCVREREGSFGIFSDETAPPIGRDEAEAV